MATLIQIKAVKPFVEKVIRAEGINDNITIGVKVYDSNDLDQVRDTYLENLDNKKLLRAQSKAAKLGNYADNADLTDEEFEQCNKQNQELQAEIKSRIQTMLQYQVTFCKQNICYIKNASLTINDKDILIQDTREAQPIESLWATPDECLAALLDLYLQSNAYRDSLFTTVPSLVFNTDIKEEELKNSNK